MTRLGNMLSHAWNAFTNQTTENQNDFGGDVYYGSRPDRVRVSFANERSIVSSIYTHLAADVAAYVIRHVRLDDEERYLENVDSGLNECLLTNPNLDQAPKHLRQDMAATLFSRGVMVLVPVETTLNPDVTGGWDVNQLRVGYVENWRKDKVRVNVYNEKSGLRESVTLPKKFVAIVENPWYSIMNEQSSTLQRLVRKLNLLDTIDEQLASGKLDIIIQLPYVIKSESKRAQAESRRKDIETQLMGSKYGIAYTDGTEKIVQLNRPAENNMMASVEKLLEMVYTELGLTPEILNGTADERAMINYQNHTIKPVVDAIVEEMRRKFLTKTARTQGQSIQSYRDPFMYLSAQDLAEIADKMSRNEILTSNEIRQIMGFKPSKDPKADQLVNSNMPQDGAFAGDAGGADMEQAFGGVNDALDKAFNDLDVEE